MKLKALSALILFNFMNLASAEVILKAQEAKHPLFISYDKKVLIIKNNTFNENLAITKCSEASLNYFIQKIEKLSSNTVSVKHPKSFALEVKGKSKSISPESSLGKYVKNIDQYILTLKTELSLACKK